MVLYSKLCLIYDLFASCSFCRPTCKFLSSFISLSLALSIVKVRRKIPGIYCTWKDCYVQVNRYPGALHKKYNTEAEALTAYYNYAAKTIPNQKKDKELKTEDIIILC